MINFIKRKIAKHKLMTTRQEFSYELKSYNLEGYGLIGYAQWLNPFAYSMIANEDKLGFFKQFVSKGDFVLDIGANIGGVGTVMGLIAGPEGTILAFEPNPNTFKILKINSGLNTDKINIIPLPYAATKEDGEYYYNSVEATFNNGGITKTRKEAYGKYELGEKITGININNLLYKDYSNLLDSLTCIKVDTEGLDYEILLSLREIIAKYKPSVIFEVFMSVTKEDRNNLFDLFDQLGYDLFLYIPYDRNNPIKKLARKDMTKKRYFDVYATCDK